MLLLTFRAGENLYAIDARRVAEVVPLVGLRKVPQTPDYLAGLLGYRGGAVPVVDFGVLIGGATGRETLGTRLILTEFTTADGQARLIGVVAEDVIHVVVVKADAFVSRPMRIEEAPYLGALVRIDEGIAQLVAPDKLLSERVQDALYGGAAEPG